MITVSDMDATNILIDHVGMESLKNYFTEKGYTGKKLQWKMLAQGSENYTTLQDTMGYLKNLYKNRGNQKYSDML